MVRQKFIYNESWETITIFGERRLLALGVTWLELWKLARRGFRHSRNPRPTLSWQTGGYYEYALPIRPEDQGRGGCALSSTVRSKGRGCLARLAGVQCLETPDGITVVRAGESSLVPEGPPMMLCSVGTETRRSVLLVLHDSSKPWMMPEMQWKPKGLCPK
jgi:hypothetical protein